MARASSNGWAGLFATAFKRSRNAMILVDAERRVVDVNPAMLKLVGYRRAELLGRPLWTLVAGGPLVTPAEWAIRLSEERFTGEAGLVDADGTVVAVQWGATSEMVTGHRLVLFVALSTSRWGRHFRRSLTPATERGGLSKREREIVRLVSLGWTGPEIADELHIAHDTVRTHVRNAMDKLGARSRAHLVAKALGDGHVLHDRAAEPVSVRRGGHG